MVGGRPPLASSAHNLQMGSGPYYVGNLVQQIFANGWQIIKMWERSKQIKFLQDQLSMPAAMALNYCCTAVCVRDYIKQGLNISCLDYRCSFLFLFQQSAYC